MKDLPLSALRAFAAVHDAGGVCPAARLLGIAHSSISHHCRELEAWLGTPLFETPSSGRPVMTRQGKALGVALNRNFSGISQAIDGLRQVRPANAVTIAIAASFAARWLLPRLPDLQRRAPWIELSVIIDATLRDPQDQGADLALRMGRGPWPDVHCEPLMGESLFPVLSPALWETVRQSTDPDVLKRLPLLHDRDPSSSWADWKAVYGPADLDVRRGPRFSSSDLELHAAAQGLGVALARGRFARGDLELGLLVRPFGELGVPLPDSYWIVRPPLQPERSALTLVLDWLRQQASAAAS